MENNILDTILFSSGSFFFTWGMLISIVFSIFILYTTWRATKSQRRIPLYNLYNIEVNQQRKLEIMLMQLAFVICLYILMVAFHLDYSFFLSDSITLSISVLLISVIIIMIARLVDWVLSNILVHKYEQGRSFVRGKEVPNKIAEGISKITKNVKYIVYVVSAILILRNFNLDIDLLPDHITNQDLNFKVSNVLLFVLILLIGRLSAWLIIQLFLFNIYKRKNLDSGSQFAINQLIKYVIYFLSLIHI